MPARSKAQRAGIAASVTIAVSVCLPLTMRSEGVRTVPYLDPAHIRTVCYGETQAIEDRVYSRGECGDMLRARLAQDYAHRLVECMPELVEEPYPGTVFAALLDASYNAGPLSVCRKFAPLFNARWITATCAALPGWYVTARDRRSGAIRHLRGLEDRRRREQRLCLGQMA
jgi:GH24 family phage-related lysozyme (muramidase)